MLLPWGEPVSAETAEAWLFPELVPLVAPEPEAPPARKRRPRRAAAPEAAQPAAAPGAAAKRGVKARPAGIARKRSAFAAAREG
jgi:hypothetical protein